MKSTTEMLMEFVADNSNGSRHVGCTEERSRAHPMERFGTGFHLDRVDDYYRHYRGNCHPQST